jgi:hypothetical protein
VWLFIPWGGAFIQGGPLFKEGASILGFNFLKISKYAQKSLESLRMAPKWPQPRKPFNLWKTKKKSQTKGFHYFLVSALVFTIRQNNLPRYLFRAFGVLWGLAVGRGQWWWRSHHDKNFLDKKVSRRQNQP